MKPYFEMPGAVLYHGDCLEVLPTLAAGSVDAVVTDPPYGTTACKWDSVIPLGPMWQNLRELVRQQGAVVLCAKQPFSSALVASNREQFRYCWYWEKSKGANFAQTSYRPLAVVEELAVFSRAPAVWSKQPTMHYYPQKEKLEKPYHRRFAGTLKGSKSTVSPSAFCRNPERLAEKTYTEKTPRNLLYASDDHEDGLHPTQKPVALMEYMVRTYTTEWETVLDFCFGSGTTGVACVQTGRRFVGVELSEAYCEIAARRIEAAAVETPLYQIVGEG